MVLHIRILHISMWDRLFNATRDRGQKTQLVVGWWAHGRFNESLFFTNKNVIFFNDCWIVCLGDVKVLRSIYLSKDI